MSQNYHVSKLDLGPQVILTAQNPESACGSEGGHPRVCFSSTIAGCLASVSGGSGLGIPEVVRHLTYPRGGRKKKEEDLWYESKDEKKYCNMNPAIYVTRRVLVLPPDISDFRETGELWSLKDIPVTRVGYVCLLTLMTENRAKKTKMPVTTTPEQLKFWLLGTQVTKARMVQTR